MELLDFLSHCSQVELVALVLVLLLEVVKLHALLADHAHDWSDLES